MISWTAKPVRPSPVTIWSKSCEATIGDRRICWSTRSERPPPWIKSVQGARRSLARSFKPPVRPVATLGIELLDLRFKRINYVERVQKEVFERMIAERNRVAAEYLSEGQGEAARIRGTKERETAGNPFRRLS